MKPNARHRIRIQSGQATLELTAILTGLIALTLGLLFVAGLSLSDNRTLLEAKADSESGARNDGEAESADGEVRAWNYGQTDIGGETVTIPFSSKDSPRWQTYSGQLDSTATGLQSGAYSAGTDSGAYQYRWLSPTYFDTGTRDFSSTLTNGYNAARLYHGSDDSVGPVYGFDESGLWTDGAYVDNSTNRRRTRRAMRDTFHQWFGVKINDRQLADSPANQVYMPTAKKADQETEEDDGE